MPCQPRMLEPSKPKPSSKTPSSSLPTGIVKCCEVPRRSVKRRSTALTSFSRQRARTSRGVMREGLGTGDWGLEYEYEKSGRRCHLPLKFFTTHHSLTHQSTVGTAHPT